MGFFNRRPKGTPGGGQFTGNTARVEPQIDLVARWDDAPLRDDVTEEPYDGFDHVAYPEPGA